jgi:molybdopterin biosynthesis enzyme MoaB
MHLALHDREAKSIYKHKSIKNTEDKIEQKLAEVLTPDRTVKNDTANQITNTLHNSKKEHLHN